MKSSNDNNINPVLKKFMDDKVMYQACLQRYPEVCASLQRKQRLYKSEDTYARFLCNHIWFMTFEMSFREAEIEINRSKIQVVK